MGSVGFPSAGCSSIELSAIQPRLLRRNPGSRPPSAQQNRGPRSQILADPPLFGAARRALNHRTSTRVDNSRLKRKSQAIIFLSPHQAASRMQNLKLGTGTPSPASLRSAPSPAVQERG